MFKLFFLCFFTLIQWTFAVSSHDSTTGRHQRMIKQRAPDKRFVIPSGANTKGHQALANIKVDTSLLRRDGIFRRSNITLKLDRVDNGSRDLMKRGELHPLLYWTQHYNRALSRRSTMTTTQSSIRKRSTADLATAAEGRIRKRWISLHSKRLAPTLHLARRNRLIPLIKDSNMFGLDRGLAAKLKTNNAASSSSKNNSLRASNVSASADPESTAGPSNDNSAGFSQERLDAALKGTVTPFQGRTAEDSVGLSIEANDVGYFATMQFGTPASPFRILMDSGSADFWIPSQQCNSDGDCGGHRTLGTKSSSTFALVKPQKQFQVTYGTGNVAGILVQDTVALEDNSLKVENLTFGVTIKESSEFSDPDVPFDGLMGLALSSLSEEKTQTFIEALAEQKLVDEPQMGYHLASVADYQDSQVTFGGVDSTKFEGELTEVPNQSKVGFWQARMTEVTVNGKAVKIAARTAILDTGTSLIVAPAADAKALHAVIPGSQSDGQGGYTIPCTTTAEVAFEFGGKSFAMTAANLLFVPVDQANLQGDCQSAIGEGNIDSEGSWLLGDAFLKDVYLATDARSGKIGLAPSKSS